MKYIKSKLLLPLILIIVTANGCGPVKDCDAIADEFYSAIKSGEYKNIIGLIDEQALERTPESTWIEGMAEKQKETGDLISYQRINFDTQTTDNVTRTILKFNVKYSKAELYERMEFIMRNGKQYITYYAYDEDKPEPAPEK